jgi:WhiB family transcriptional regulator, redox-sensing transcriptional regulator
VMASHEAELKELRAPMGCRVEEAQRVAPADLLQQPTWQQRAGCRNVRTEIFFPVRGACPDEAKLVCSACPVRRECLAFALADQTLQGIWGGTSERERRTLRRDRRWVA